jgi:hypothetical protein
MDVFKRSSKQDQAGRHGNIGDKLKADVLQFGFQELMDWGFPVISAMVRGLSLRGLRYGALRYPAPGWPPLAAPASPPDPS